MRVEEYKKMFIFEDFYWWYKGLHMILLRQFKKYNIGNRSLDILDAGCGTGKILELLKGYGNVTGLDVSRDAISFARMRNTGVGLLLGSAVSLPFDNNTFDCVVSSDVLCSISDDKRAVKEFLRVLKKSGILIINLPAYQWLYSSHDVAVYTKHRYFKKEAIEMLSGNGFKIEKITYWNTILCPLEVIIRAINKFLPLENYKSDLRYLPGLVNSLLTGMVYFEAMLINTFNFPFGLSLFVIARKA